jgi:predicted nuclease with TOPRIM domain
MEERIKELRVENHRLIGQIDRLTDEVDRLREELLSTAQKKADAIGRLEELLKAVKPRRSARATGNGSDKEAENSTTGT